jgi:hypothetical protein
MDLWEYYSLVIRGAQEGWEDQSIDRSIAGKTISDLLNQVGQGGWELVSLTPSIYFRTN